MLPKNCNFCGLCCTLIVKLTRKDVERIELLGHDRRKFAETDRVGNLILKRIDGLCYFLDSKNSEPRCKIYDSRPSRCSAFPGKKLCSLRHSVVYKDMSNMCLNVRRLWEKSPEKT